ncbi:MAG: eukaryotic-like serine/threonine-protein kinase [Myxococcales bacterium]|jgi:serine/threonine-protein kinase|nr:eukaryotic-like serine/threonine-protein kinase [Myxococcales bacterium]
MVVIGPGQPGLIAGKYQIERLIGKGGMAEVFAAVNVRTGKRVALKRINPALAATDEARARFKREALAAGRINHPNVVTVFDVVEHQGATCLVMELLEGETLSQLLLRTKVLTPEVAIAVLIPAMRGVAAAHAHGVVHRDLKPDNIFLCRVGDNQRGEAKVLDFGVSKLAADGVDDVNITATGGLVGTPIYMAPEQVRGGKQIDQRTDVYTLGCVLYQMLTGRPPYQGEIYSALMVTIATQDPPRLRSLRPDVPVELEKIVHRAMARDVDARFQDVPAFIAALESFVRAEQLSTGPVPLPANPTTDRTIKLIPPRANWQKRVAIAVAVVLVLLATKLIIDARYPVPDKQKPQTATNNVQPGFPTQSPPPPSMPPAKPVVNTVNAPSIESPGKPGQVTPSAETAGGLHPGTGTAGPSGAPAKPRDHNPVRPSRPTRSSEATSSPTNPPANRSQPNFPSSTPPSRAGRITIDDF